VERLREDRPITYSELMDCYNKIKDEEFVTPATIQFRLIDIEIAKIELSDPNMDRVEQAKRLADNLVERIKAGEDFGQLAQQSQQTGMRVTGGLWKPIDPDSLAKPYDVLAKEAEKLKPGQIAGPIETNSHIFIMKLEDKRPKNYEPFEKVQIQLEQRILTERRLKAIEKFNAKLMQQAQLNEKDKFVEYCLEKIYQMSNQ
jgi:peptidyl-prolyl cis-trans isomerase SurA